jgi:hypothetical protein
MGFFMCTTLIFLKSYLRIDTGVPLILCKKGRKVPAAGLCHRSNSSRRSPPQQNFIKAGRKKWVA